MTTIFSKIATREIPAHIVAESDDYIAFLDVNPLVEGHVLVIPKKEVDYIFDLDEALYLGLMTFAKIVAEGMKSVLICKRIGVAVIGLEVPHTHIHLVPLNQIGDINFSREKLSPTEEELTATAQKIRAAIL